MNVACGETAIENANAAKSMVSLFLKIARSMPKMNIVHLSIPSSRVVSVIGLTHSLHSAQLNALAIDVHVLLGHVTEEDPSNQVQTSLPAAGQR
jgi:hypothetical protein